MSNVHMRLWRTTGVLVLAASASLAAQAPATTSQAPAPALHVANHRVHAAERPARDPASRHERPGRGGERLVSRRFGQRTRRSHRLRASLRTRDVRRVDARARRIVRQLARGRRRQQQRIDQQRPHQLHHRHSVQRARPGVVPRIGSHGLSARRQGAGEGGRSARRREEREASERGQPALRSGVRRARHAALSARGIRTAGR